MKLISKRCIIKMVLFFGVLGFIFSLYLMLFSSRTTYAQNKINLGLLGYWKNHGWLQKVKILRREEVRQENQVIVNYACCVASRGIVFFDINSRSVISFIPIDGCKGIEKGGENNKDVFYIYATAGTKGLYIFNIENIKKPYFVAECDTPGDAEAVAIDGDYAFVADGSTGLQIIDISTRNTPRVVGSCDTPGDAEAVAIDGDYAFVTDGRNIGLQIIDISIKSAPGIVGSCDTPGDALNVAIEGDYAFVADGFTGLQIIDISTKNARHPS